MKSKHELFKSQPIQELIEKEISYNQDMQLLIEVLRKEQDILDLVDFKWEPLNKLHNEIKELKIISDALIRNLNKAKNADKDERVALRLERISIIKEYLSVYRAYAFSYKNYLTKKNDKDSRYDDIEKEVAKNGKRLCDLLSLPFQRGLKYKLLLESTLNSNVTLDRDATTELTVLIEKFNIELKRINDEFDQKYKFGDYTKAVISYFWGSAPKNTNAVVAVDIDDDEDKDFVDICTFE